MRNLLKTILFLLPVVFFLESNSQVIIPFAFWQKLECYIPITTNFTAAGNYTYNIPGGCRKLTAYTWGGGGGGGHGPGGTAGANGGAGGNALIGSYNITGITTLTITVGGGGKGAATDCALPGTGGTGFYIGGTAVASTAGTAGGGVAVAAAA